MSLEYSVKNDGGASGKVTTQGLVQRLQGNGEQVTGISADGTTLQLQDGKGQFNVPVEKVLNQLGWQIHGIKPINPDYSAVNSNWRAKISAIGDDDMMKEAYLTSQLKHNGIENPQVKGSGRDWYAFDPESNRYLALTNNPKWDISDAAEAAVSLPRLIGATVGGTAGALAGAPSGPGAFVTGGLGAAAGGGAAQAATLGLLGASDPIFKEVMEQKLKNWTPENQKSYDSEMLSDAVMGGTAAGSPVAMNKGAISGAAKGLGAAGEAGGNVLAKTAKFIQKPLSEEAYGFTPEEASIASKDIASSFIPGANSATAYGVFSQLPSQAIRGGAKGLGHLGESSFINEIAPDLASKMRVLNKYLTRPAENKLTAEAVANKIGGLPQKTAENSTEDILGRVGEFTANKGYRDETSDLYAQFVKIGVPSEKASEAAENIARSTAKDSFDAGTRRSKIFRKVGRGFQNVENLGIASEKLGRGVTTGILKGAQGVGNAAQYGGQALNTAGTLAQPFENRALLRYGPSYGSEEIYPDKTTWLRKPNSARINPYLADM